MPVCQYCRICKCAEAALNICILTLLLSVYFVSFALSAFCTTFLMIGSIVYSHPRLKLNILVFFAITESGEIYSLLRGAY